MLVGALPAFADTVVDDDEMLGSGAEAPVDEEEPAKPEPVEEDEAVEVVQTTPDAQLASTGLDSGAALLIGLGLTAAGGAAVLASRRRKSVG